MPSKSIIDSAGTESYSVDVRIHKSVLDLIKQHYHVVDMIDLWDYDSEPSKLQEILGKYSNKHFDHTQRLIVLYHETDYFPKFGIIGNNMYNFLKICAALSIPMEKVMILTNHYGIENLIKNAVRDICNEDSIQVICTSLWYDCPETVEQSATMPPENLTHLFCCLNGCSRSHRIMTLCMLNEYGLLDRGLISYHFGKA
jgi:hypothetical protein